MKAARISLIKHIVDQLVRAEISASDAGAYLPDEAEHRYLCLRLARSQYKTMLREFEREGQDLPSDSEG